MRCLFYYFFGFYTLFCLFSPYARLPRQVPGPYDFVLSVITHLRSVRLHGILAWCWPPAVHSDLFCHFLHLVLSLSSLLLHHSCYLVFIFRYFPNLLVSSQHSNLVLSGHTGSCYNSVLCLAGGDLAPLRLGEKSWGAPMLSTIVGICTLAIFLTWWVLQMWCPWVSFPSQIVATGGFWLCPPTHQCEQSTFEAGAGTPWNF